MPSCFCLISFNLHSSRKHNQQECCRSVKNLHRFCWLFCFLEDEDWNYSDIIRVPLSLWDVNLVPPKIKRAYAWRLPKTLRKAPSKRRTVACVTVRYHQQNLRVSCPFSLLFSPRNILPFHLVHCIEWICCILKVLLRTNMCEMLSYSQRLCSLPGFVIMSVRNEDSFVWRRYGTRAACMRGTTTQIVICDTFGHFRNAVVTNDY